MPSAARKPRQQPTPRPGPTKVKPREPEHIDDLEEQNEIEERLLRPSELEGPWRDALKAPDVEPDIWTAQELMPQALRNECMAYLYRLEPAVFNAAGKGSNIGKYTIPVTQEDISKKHGGGKYKLWIKRGSRTLFQEIFILGGEPILSPDQTTRDGKPAAPRSTDQMSDVVRAVKEILVETRGSGQEKATEGAVEIMKAGFTNALDMQKRAAESPTGDKVTDALLPRLLERMMQPPPAPAPQADPMALMEKMVSIFMKFQKPHVDPIHDPDHIKPIDQLNFVKDVLGVDSVKEIFNFHERKSDRGPWYGQALVQLAQNLPTVFQMFSQQQERAFQRQVYLAGLKPGEVPNPAFQPPSAQVIPIATAPPTQEQLIEKLIQEVVRFFNAGFDGYGCAAHILMTAELAPVWQQFSSVLSDEEQLRQTISQIPALAMMSANPEWPEFVGEFSQTFRDMAMPRGPQDDEQEEPPTGADTAAEAKPGAAKKKAVKKPVAEMPKPN